MAQITNLEEVINELVSFSEASGKIQLSLYEEYDVKRGLRDSTGKGVLTGLTEISDVIGYEVNEMGQKLPCDGKLFYQGYDIRDLVGGFFMKRRFGFEEAAYLLMFGKLPTEEQLTEFNALLAGFRTLPDGFTRDVIMKAVNPSIMNALQRGVISLYAYDKNADDTSIPNIVRQCLSLTAKFPQMAVYSYSTQGFVHEGRNLVLRNPDPELSLAENLLQILHADGKYTELEARVLDAALVIHAEHGGGNNSTFTTHVVSSTGTDTYSAVAASLGSLKGPKHGGANLKVQDMMQNIKEHVDDWNSDSKVRRYLEKILDGKAFDHAGLIYGLGHAVYTLSDPRAVILKKCARELAEEKGCLDEYDLYDRVERIGKELIKKRRIMMKPVCANVDFYSGFVYSMLGLPKELFTPLFAIARIAGWSAHRIEEMVNSSKIYRPAYKYVGHHVKYIPLEDRVSFFYAE